MPSSQNFEAVPRSSGGTPSEQPPVNHSGGELSSSSARVPTIEEVHGVPLGSFPSLLDEVEVIDVDAPPDTSKDAAIAHELFVKLNRDALGIPGDEPW